MTGKMKKKVRFRIEGEAAWLDDIKVQQVLPNEFVQAIGPFVRLEHIHSFKEIPGNQSQPTRGIATLTYIISGEVEHSNSIGNHTKLSSGGVHWMKAGKGVIHNEAISSESSQACPDVSVVQFWINLPSNRKSEEPEYYFLSAPEIPKQYLENNAGWIKILSGVYGNTVANIPNYSSEFVYHLHLEANGKFSTNANESSEYAIFLPANCAVINDIRFQAGDCIVFASLGEIIEIINDSETAIGLIFFGGEPYKEPIVTDGNFVMNNPHEISQAYNDYYDGKYGQIKTRPKN
jgi:redox-sensitive bicupin YhaK (pirin superfamily)